MDSAVRRSRSDLKERVFAACASGQYRTIKEMAEALEAPYSRVYYSYRLWHRQERRALPRGSRGASYLALQAQLDAPFEVLARYPGLKVTHAAFFANALAALTPTAPGLLFRHFLSRLAKVPDEVVAPRLKEFLALEALAKVAPEGFACRLRAIAAETAAAYGLSPTA